MWFSSFFSLELATSLVTFAFALFVMINVRYMLSKVTHMHVYKIHILITLHLQASSLGQILNYFIVVIFMWTNLLTRCFVSEIFSNLVKICIIHEIRRNKFHYYKFFWTHFFNRIIIYLKHFCGKLNGTKLTKKIDDCFWYFIKWLADLCVYLDYPFLKQLE